MPETKCASDSEARASAQVQAVAERLGIQFNALETLQQALIHTSYLNEQVESGVGEFEQSNERLEFLGDSVLGFIAADFLYQRYPDMAEGELTVGRVALVRRETLARWMDELDITQFLYIAQGERQSENLVSDRILADTFEAILGAIYLDQGIETVRTFLERRLARDVGELLRQHDLTNYKGVLQEVVQEWGQSLPEYKIIETSGPEHNRQFVVEVTYKSATIGQGGGRSKRSAEQAAARDAVERMRRQQEGTGNADGGTL